MSTEINIRRVEGFYLVDFGNVRFSASGWDLFRLGQRIGFVVLDEDKVPGDRLVQEERKLLANQISARIAASQPSLPTEPRWIDCTQEMPPKNKNHCWLAWITCQNKNGGYIDLVSYGDYVCDNPDIRPGDEGYCEDNDDGNYKQFGWHREEETHGGEYDYIFVNLNGKVTHWMPLPAAPKQNEAER